MSEEQPEAKDRLGKDVKDGIGNNLSIDARNARSISNTPDADRFQQVVSNILLGTYMGYTVQRIKVKLAMEMKNVAVFLSLF